MKACVSVSLGTLSLTSSSCTWTTRSENFSGFPSEGNQMKNENPWIVLLRSALLAVIIPSLTLLKCSDSDIKRLQFLSVQLVFCLDLSCSIDLQPALSVTVQLKTAHKNTVISRKSSVAQYKSSTVICHTLNLWSVERQWLPKQINKIFCVHVTTPTVETPN